MLMMRTRVCRLLRTSNSHQWIRTTTVPIKQTKQKMSSNSSSRGETSSTKRLTAFSGGWSRSSSRQASFRRLRMRGPGTAKAKVLRSYRASGTACQLFRTSTWRRKCWWTTTEDGRTSTWWKSSTTKRRSKTLKSDWASITKCVPSTSRGHTLAIRSSHCGSHLFRKLFFQTNTANQTKTRSDRTARRWDNTLRCCEGRKRKTNT